MNKSEFIKDLYYMNRDEREAIGLNSYLTVDEYYVENLEFVEKLWRNYEETGEYPLPTYASKR